MTELIRQRLLALHAGAPQHEASCEHALRAIEAGLADLARLGHQFHLADGPAPQVVLEWPQIMFHAKAAPQGRLVLDEFALRELGPGWFPTLADAQRFQGFVTQFSGRGGVKLVALPAIR